MNRVCVAEKNIGSLMGEKFQFSYLRGTAEKAALRPTGAILKRDGNA